MRTQVRFHNGSATSGKAFTLIELLMVITIIVILAARLLPAVSRSKGKAASAVCLSNVKQINTAMLMFADEYDGFPRARNSTYLYWEFIGNYVGVRQPLWNEGAKIYECPLNPMLWVVSRFGDRRRGPWGVETSRPFTNSYLFNGQNAMFDVPGIAGAKPVRLIDPERTVNIYEGSAFKAMAAHSQYETQMNDAPNMIGFADGHVKLTKIYWVGLPGEGNEPWRANPPASYGYKWSAK